MQYNRNIAKEYFGTDDPEEVAAMFATVEDCMAKGKELAEASNGEKFLFNCPEHVLRLGLAMTSEPFVVDGKLNIDDSYGKALALVEQAIADNSVSLQECWSAPWSAELQSDTDFFYLCPSWWLGDIKNNDPDAEGQNKYGLITLPDNMTASWGGTYYFINAAAEQTDKEAAFAWMNWLCCTAEGALRVGTIYDSTISNAANQALLEMMMGATAGEALEMIKATVLETYPELG